MKRLNKLIKCKYKTPIYGIKTNSKEVVYGDLFVAVHGMNHDHHDYIFDAIEKGAVAIISEKKIDTDVPVVIVKNTNKVLNKILKKFYENIEEEFSFIGITGTDGKTTTSTFISYILSDILNCSNIGTNGLYYKDYYEALNNTTPSIEDLSKILLKLNTFGCKYVSMEVSSEALLHKRLDNIKYNVGILTNITEDHLNVHHDIDSYVFSKSLLFTKIKKNGFALLNKDDIYCDFISSKCKCKIFTYGFDVNSDFVICKSDDNIKSNCFNILHNGEVYKIETNFIERYNLYNITAAFACSLLLGVESSFIISRIKSLNTIPGRGEKLYFGQDYTIVLDYAHTENAIKNILSTYSVNKKNKVITLTGSAGGREKEKRSKIGKIVTDLSDFVIFTEDDPRDEDVLDIIDDMLCFVNKNNYEIIENRKEAIYYALSIANKDDVVLILGKGRDNYMAIGNEKIYYSDYDVISSFFID